MSENFNYPTHSILTQSGLVFDLENPTIDMICIEDIAHALSLQVRFGGHIKQFYSVAEHSTYVCYQVKPEHKMAGLLHDASEAYLGDMPGPFKGLMPNYKKHEDTIMKLIAEKFGFQYPFHPEVKQVDKIVLKSEWNLFKKSGLRGLDPKEAERNFLKNFNRINSNQ